MSEIILEARALSRIAEDVPAAVVENISPLPGEVCKPKSI